MGALRINRKRGDDYFTLNGKFPSLGTPNSTSFDDRIDTHISKKQKTLSFSNPGPEQPLKSTASRLSRYPAPVNPIRREVHAPCRVLRFGSLAKSSKEGSAGGIGNFLSSSHSRGGKNLDDFSSFGYGKNENEVIDVDAVSGRDDVGGDSIMEDVENVDDAREWHSLVLDRSSEETGGDVLHLPSSEGKKLVEHDVQQSSSVISDTMNKNAEVANMDLLSLNQKLEALGLPMHKKLLETAERRDPKLSSLKFQIELNEKRLANFQSLYRVKKPQEEDILQDLLREPFVPLTEEEESKVSWAFSNSNRRKILVTHESSNIEITGEHMQCLRPGAWLNDEVINLYLELLKERETREPKKFLKCHFFNTFFYKKLIGGRNGYDYKSVRRWTSQRKLGYSLSECDKIFVPIHKEIHWCLAVINKKDKKFQYLDSLGGVDGKVLNVLARYFADEVKDKNGEQIDVNSWEQEYVEDLPEQKNGWDCGVFMIKYADFYSRGLGLCFNQEHMPYFRRRTVKELLGLKAD